MGFRPQNMTRSERLAEIVRRCEQANNRDELSNACDMTSTAGYDNDGSIGPELLDNGIGLGIAALRYDANATVFFAFGEDRGTWVTCYYQYGKDEDDAIRRLCGAMGWSFPTQDPEIPEDDPETPKDGCPNFDAGIACDCDFCQGGWHLTLLH